MALDLVDYVFSWSLKDVFNHQFYKDKVKEIPKTFTSVEEYLASYTFPLIEETHVAVCSSMENLSPGAPNCRIVHVQRLKRKTKNRYLFYKIVVSKDGDTENGKEIYEPQVGDLMLLSNVKCFSIADLKRSRTSLPLALVTGNMFSIDIRSSNPIEFENGSSLEKRGQLYAVFLTNMTPSIRIWKALHPEMKLANMKVINRVLCTNSTVGVDCHCCLLSQGNSICGNSLLSNLQTFNLNESQTDAVVTAISTKGCKHQSSVKLIWGPPGTGKTKTVSVLLWVLKRMKCRTLICTPTNIALIEVTSRLLNLVKDSPQHLDYGLGDIVLYGNEARLQINDYPDLHDVFLDYRTAKLKECFLGWNHQLKSLIALLKESGYQYLRYLEQKKKEKEDESRRSTGVSKTELQKNKQEGVLTIDEFIKESFTRIWMDLKFFITSLLKHLPTSFISVRVVEDMNKALHSLDSLKTLLHGSVTSEDLKCAFLDSEDLQTAVGGSNTLLLKTTRNRCLHILKTLNKSFSAPDIKDSCSISDFCLQHAYLIFSTASGSAKLHKATSAKLPLELLVIDEAAQLKECESAIPLQLPGVRHAILIGDEQQLPAMVQSEISEKAEFGRSLFARLVSLGHKKHLLNIQYRMHPSISLFPNTEFYDKQILDAPKVKESNHERHFLQGNMYGAYSFINVAHGTEAPGHGKRNMVEVAVVSEIVKSLFKASVASGQKFRVGVISPYKAQVFAIKEKFGGTYDTVKDFSVSVRTVDGFQGGEEDVIIVSTVRSNGKGSVGFLVKHQRTNVALTRARHCLWVLGNGPTLIDSGSIWGKLVLDAKDRGCFFDADKDKGLREAIIDSLVELGEFDKLYRTDTLLFDGTRWKVLFVDDFSTKIRRANTQKKVIALLMKLANGWRHPKKQEVLYLMNSSISSELLQVYNVDGSSFKLVWTVDILTENHKHTQVIKVWDILPLEGIPELAKRLGIIFGKYKADDINRRKFKCSEGDIEVPMSWEISIATTSEEERLSSIFTSLQLGRNQILRPENGDADKPTITMMKQRSRAGTTFKDLFWHMVNSICAEM